MAAAINLSKLGGVGRLLSEAAAGMTKDLCPEEWWLMWAPSEVRGNTVIILLMSAQVRGAAYSGSGCGKVGGEK